jgi:serine/threonine protein kinase
MTNSAGAVKLADFGIAKDVEATRLTVTGGIVGTADYMSPEQAEGRRVTRKSDIYSLGVCLYHMLTGRLPFIGKTYLDVIRAHRFSLPESPKSLNPAIPGRVTRLVESMMEKDPDKRPSSATDVLGAIDSLNAAKGELSDDERDSAREMVKSALFPAADWKTITAKALAAAVLLVLSVMVVSGLRYRYFTTADYKYSLGIAAFNKGEYATARDYFGEVRYFHPDSLEAEKAADRITEIYYISRTAVPRDAPKVEKPSSPDFLFESATNLIQSGKTEEGVRLLRLIARDYRDSEFGRKAAEALKPFDGKSTTPAAALLAGTASDVPSSPSDL